VSPRAVVVATAVAAANRADLFILALLVRCPGGLTPHDEVQNVTVRSPAVARVREKLGFHHGSGFWSVVGDNVSAWRRAQRSWSPWETGRSGSRVPIGSSTRRPT